MDRFFRVALLLTIVGVLGVPTPSFAVPLPDTGQTKCYNNTEEITCPQPGEDFYGQDGDYLINPPSYTKLDANGNDLPDSATSWVMVRDNVTGLIWEVKTDDGSIHDKDNMYNWQDAQDVFIIQVNASDFGGYSDWRLPTVKELTSIANLGRSAPVIDTDFFPNTKGEQGYSNYWSNSPYASNSDETWYVDFSYLQVYWGHKSIKYYVRCVRGEQTINSFVDNADGTVTETTTGLMWQQAPASGQYNWKEALSFGDNLILAGYDDWRLPNQRELQSIADYDAYNPAIDTNYFPGTSSSYWASSRTPVSFPYRVSFDSGQVFTDWAAEHVNVRGVRGGQNQISGHLFITSPAQASMYKIGNPMPISWEPQGIAGNVQLSISREGGKEGTFEIIEETTQNDGSYNWTVTEPVSVNCVLKIEPLSDISKGTIQGLFTIYGPPTVSTGLASSVGSESVTLNGTVNPGFVSATAVFEWGTDATYGNEISATQNPLTGDTDQNVSAKLTGLSPGTTYHYRVKATNTAGSSYGGDQSFITTSSGNIINIPSDYSTIQGGIDAASNGDTVMVADGTYKGEGNKNLDFKGKAITVQSENGAQKCIIDCENEGRGFYFHSGEGADSVVSGFTITNGNESITSISGGAGIYCSSSSPTITDCIVSNNRTSFMGGGGGGIFCSSSSPTITNSIIIGNVASGMYGASGGGISCAFDSCPTITNCTVSNNTAYGSGGGISCSSSSPTITNCIISGNVSYGRYSGYGGGISCGSSSSPTITNCTVSNNTATGMSGYGGGIWFFSSSPTITNSIFWSNSPDEIDCDSTSSVTFTYSDIKGGYTGLGNIDADPLFVGGGAYQLTASSPCIDRGTSSGAPSTDIDGKPRPQGAGYDMGAYEYCLASSVPTATTGLATNITTSSATLNGTLNPNGATSWYYFEYGTTSIYGSTTESATAGAGTTSLSVNADISELELSSTYHYRLVGANSAGRNYGEDQTFVTSPSAPTVTTDSATAVLTDSATLNGTVNPNGANTTYYFEYGTSTSYGSTTTVTELGSGTSTVSVNAVISGLELGATYHFRLVATNSLGTTNGDDQTFTTNALAPTVNTGSATSVTSSSTTLNGTINPNGAGTTYHFEYGTTTAYGLTTLTTSAGSGTTEVTVTANITGLSSNTTYHFRLVATNSAGTANGSDRTFFTSTIPPVAPSVTTGSATYITSTSATLNGQVNPNGSSTQAYFEYGTTMSYGFVTTAEDIGSGSSSVSVSATITDLIPDTAYHYRLTATNSGGTSFGDDKILYQELVYVSFDGTCGGNTPCFLSIQNAIDSATSCSLIRICEGAFDEDVIADQVYELILSGGWDSTFTAQESETLIHSLTITEAGGPVETDNIVLQ